MVVLPGVPLEVAEAIRLASRADLMATSFSSSLAACIEAASIPVDPVTAKAAAAQVMSLRAACPLFVIVSHCAADRS